MPKDDLININRIYKIIDTNKTDENFLENTKLLLHDILSNSTTIIYHTNNPELNELLQEINNIDDEKEKMKLFNQINTRLNSISTGYEIYDDNGHISISGSIQKVSNTLAQRDPAKYKGFLEKMVKKTSLVLHILLVPNAGQRATTIGNIYMLFRVLDDIIDGDTPYTIDSAKRAKIIEDFITVIDTVEQGTYDPTTSSTSNDVLDALIHKIHCQTESLGDTATVFKGLKQITKSLMFDQERTASYQESLKHNPHALPKFYKKQDLDKHFFDLDIIGTIYSTSEFFGLNPDQSVELLEPLGRASRMIYDLQDILTEPLQGLVNISQEDAERIGITDEDMHTWMKLCKEFSSELKILKNYEPTDENIKSYKIEKKKLEHSYLIQLPRNIKTRCSEHIDLIQQQLSLHNENMKRLFELNYLGNNKAIQRRTNFFMKQQVFPKMYTNEILEVKNDWQNLGFGVEKEDKEIKDIQDNINASQVIGIDTLYLRRENNKLILSNDDDDLIVSQEGMNHQYIIDRVKQRGFEHKKIELFQSRNGLYRIHLEKRNIPEEYSKNQKYIDNLSKQYQGKENYGELLNNYQYYFKDVFLSIPNQDFGNMFDNIINNVINNKKDGSNELSAYIWNFIKRMILNDPLGYEEKHEYFKYSLQYTSLITGLLIDIFPRQDSNNKENEIRYNLRMIDCTISDHLAHYRQNIEDMKNGGDIPEHLRNHISQ